MAKGDEMMGGIERCHVETDSVGESIAIVEASRDELIAALRATITRLEEKVACLERIFNTEEMKRAPRREQEAFGAGIVSP